MCKGDDSIWANYVKEIEYAYNTRISSVTRFSPYELVYGRLPPGPVYIDPIRKEERENMTTDQSVIQLRERINVLEQLAHDNQVLRRENNENIMTLSPKHIILL